MGDLTEAVEYIIESYTAYLIEDERNHTKLLAETARLIENTAKITAKTEVSRKYFEINRSKREDLFKLAMKVLDTAIKKGDLQYAQCAERTLDILYQKYPFSF